MKKFTLLAFALVMVAATGFAQIRKGTTLLGGGIGFSSSDNGNLPNPTKTYNFFVSPSVGFTVKDNQVIGFNLFYNHSATKVNDADPNPVENGLGLGGFMRRYLGLGKNFYLFGEGQLNFNYSRREQEMGLGTKTITKNYGANVALYPGIAYAVNNRFHLEAGLNNLVNIGYTRGETEFITPGNASTSDSHSFNFFTGVSSSSPFNIGFRLVLGK